MEPYLSRRAAACIDAPLFQDFTRRAAFIAAIEQAQTYQALPTKWKRMIRLAEKQMNAGR